MVNESLTTRRQRFSTDAPGVISRVSVSFIMCTARSMTQGSPLIRLCQEGRPTQRPAKKTNPEAWQAGKD